MFIFMRKFCKARTTSFNLKSKTGKVFGNIVAIGDTYFGSVSHVRNSNITITITTCGVSRQHNSNHKNQVLALTIVMSQA